MNRRKTPRRSRVWTCRPRLESLEDRCLLSSPGTLDPTFVSGGVVTTSLSSNNDTAYTVLIQPDSKIIDAGAATAGRGSVMSLVRYNADGSLDSTFGSSGKEVSNIGAGGWDAAALYPVSGTANDGKIVEAGGGGVARFNPNGSIDKSFGNKGLATVPYTIAGVVVQPDGKVVVAGDNGSAFELTRFNANGTLDTTFGSGGTATLAIAGGVYAETLVLQADGKLVVGGESGGPGLNFDLARFNTNGTLDTSFGSGGAVTGSFGSDDVGHVRLALYPTTGTDTADAGKLVAVCGINGNAGGTGSGQVGLARFNADGTLDSSFGTSGEVVTPFPNSSFQAWATALQSDGKIVVAGSTNLSGQWDSSLLRYNTNGSLDTTFSNSQGSQIFPTGGLVITPNGTGTSKALSVAIQSDGRIVTAGSTQGSTGSDFMTARYLASAPQIGSFTANPNPVTAGSSVTLTASGITDGNPNSTITQVAFYLDSNNDGKLETSTDTLLGYATQSSPGVWTLTNSSAFGLTAGTYTLFAQAQDS
jgi:uncharacterized delta-60 repeat protein